MNSGDAFNKTLTLSAALLTTVLVWAVFLVPGADLVWVTFTFLTSAMLFDVPDFKSRLTLALKMAVYAAAAQFLTGITWQSPFLRIVLLSLFSFFVLKTVSHRQESCIILLVAFLTYSLPGGMIIVPDRCIDFGLSVFIILLATSLCSIIRFPPAEKETAVFSHREAILITAELMIGMLITQLFRLSQGEWIMLTVIFIHMAVNARHSPGDLAVKRILSVPVGILLGGLYLGTLCRLDYRCVYLLPFTAAAAFFMLYSQDNYFLFSLLFMFSLTIFSDWLTGTYGRFHFMDVMLARSFSTLTGTLLLFAGEYNMQRKEKNI